VSDKLKPTRLRDKKAHAGAVDRVEVMDEKGAKVVAEAPRKYMSVVESLEREGVLDQQDVMVAERYYCDWYYGTQPSSIVPAYDERTDPSESDLNAAERRSACHHRWLKADEALGSFLQPVARYLILEVPMDGQAMPPSLQEVGRLRSPYKNRPQCKSWAVAELMGVLSVLRDVYA
jgi:hypothetical protein